MAEVQPVLITAQVVSFIPKCGKVYSKQTHVKIFVSDFLKVYFVLQIIPHQKTEILCESGFKHHKAVPTVAFFCFFILY